MAKAPIWESKDEQLLMSHLWSSDLAENPLNFVNFAFPWGKQGTPLANFKGPRKWQAEILMDITNHIRENKGKVDFNALRDAVSSGRGIGKSALVSWLVLWMLSTKIGSTVIVSANSEAQLRSVTWGELSRWLSMAINSHYFELSATRLVPAVWLSELVERDLKLGTRYWGAEGRLWSEENPDSYAGVHSQDGMMVIFDESSGIPDPIWSVAAGFFTENTLHRYWFAFSNPRRNVGYFFKCFNSKRDFWNTRNIDARDVEDTDKHIYQQIIDEYGRDSTQARVEVYGEFPEFGEDQFISSKLVEEAEKRLWHHDDDAPVVIGVDPARGGVDSTVIMVRIGRNIKAILRSHGDNTMVTVGKIIEAIKKYKPDATFIDEGGMGYGIVDRLQEQKYNVTGVNFGWKAGNKIMWGNRRAEVWGKMRDWLETACIPKVSQLKADLTGPMKKPDSTGAIYLEGKKEMKSRGLASPDYADALACTFFFPVIHRRDDWVEERDYYKERKMRENPYAL